MSVFAAVKERPGNRAEKSCTQSVVRFARSWQRPSVRTSGEAWREGRSVSRGLIVEAGARVHVPGPPARCCAACGRVG